LRGYLEPKFQSRKLTDLPISLPDGLLPGNGETRENSTGIEMHEKRTGEREEKQDIGDKSEGE